MRGAMLQAPRSLQVQELPEPPRPEGEEVLVQIRRVALCGSDIHYFMHGQHSSKVELPLLLGHEASGIVLETGKDVNHLRPGDRVAIEPGIKCGQCAYCRRGTYEFCERMKFMASRGYPGALRERIVWPASALWKLPDRLSLEEGALLEPLSVAYSAIGKVDFAGVSQAMILGAGSIGLLLFRLLRRLHPQVGIALAEKNPARLALASRQGLPIEGSRRLTGQEPEWPAVDVVFDTTGHPAAIEKSFRALTPGGQLVLIGLSPATLGMSVLDLVYKGVTIRGSYRYAGTYPQLIRLSEADSLGASQLITHRYRLDEAQEAFETASSEHCLKAVIEL